MLLAVMLLLQVLLLLQALAVQLLHQPLAHLLRAALQLAVLALGGAAGGRRRRRFILTQLPLRMPILLLRQATLQRQGLERVHHTAHMRADLGYPKIPAKEIRIASGQRLGGMPMAGGVAVAQGRHWAAGIGGILLEELA